MLPCHIGYTYWTQYIIILFPMHIHKIFLIVNMLQCSHGSVCSCNVALIHLMYPLHHCYLTYSNQINPTWFQMISYEPSHCSNNFSYEPSHCNNNFSSSYHLTNIATYCTVVVQIMRYTINFYEMICFEGFSI